MLSRDAWLLVHILGLILFLGNIIVIAVWKVPATERGAWSRFRSGS